MFMVNLLVQECINWITSLENVGMLRLTYGLLWACEDKKLATLSKIKIPTFETLVFFT